MIPEKVKINFGTIYDETIAEEIKNDTVTTATTSDSEFSNAKQTLVVDTKEKIAYLEQDYWLLDGAFVMPAGTYINEKKYNLVNDPSFENEDWTLRALDGYAEYNTDINNVYYGKKSVLFDCTMYYETAACWITSNKPITKHQNHIYYRRYYRKHVPTDKTPSSPWELVSNRYVWNVETKSADEEIYIKAKDIYDIYKKYYFDIYIDDCLVVDLTDIFGVENEPTQEECDLIFDSVQRDYNIGYEGKNISYNAGIKTETITYQFQNTHDSYGVQIKFPETSVPKDFSIVYYNGSAVIGTKNVYGNTLSLYENKDNRIGWNKVAITLKETGAYQRQRVQYVNFGARDVYTEDDLISVSVSKSTNINSDYFNSGECTFEYFNNNRFNIRTLKDLSQNAFEETRAEVYFMNKGESYYKLFNVYYVDSQTVEENGKVLTFTAYDNTYRLNNLNYSKGTVHLEGRTLGQWVNDIVEDLRLNNIIVSVDIDTEMADIVSYGYIAEVPYKEALRLIAEAGCGVLYIDTNEVIHISTYDNFIKAKSSISNANIVESTLILNNDSQYFGVKVTEYTFIQNGDKYESTELVISKGETTRNTKEISGNYLITAGMGENVANYQLQHAVKKYDYELETVTINDIDLGDKYNIEDNEVIVTDISYSLSYEDQTEKLKGIDK